MDDALTIVARDQVRWSLTANTLRAAIGRARWVVLGLAVVGAASETWAAQIHSAQPDLAMALGFAGAAALAVAAVIRQWRLGQERIQGWMMARSGAESFKREMYLFRTGTGPYALDNAAESLLNRREEILSKLRPFQKYRIEPKSHVETPRPLDANSYISERMNGPKGQIPFFTQRSNRYARAQRLLSGGEFLLAMIGALLGAALTISGKQANGAWVAVITTISSAFAAHTLAQRYDQLTISYRATADRLAGILGRWATKSSAPLAELVLPAEAILLEENQGWIAGADETSVQQNNRAATLQERSH
ncbi:MAG TPA: DUF4231 domain-containing protein [Candidatus Angelobacter sp.]|nr:DUF4231 domain-containing protein [Candidatus Angelobacter sp.]